MYRRTTPAKSAGSKPASRAQRFTMRATLCVPARATGVQRSTAEVCGCERHRARDSGWGLVWYLGGCAFERMKLRGSHEEFAEHAQDTDRMLLALADRDSLDRIGFPVLLHDGPRRLETNADPQARQPIVRDSSESCGSRPCGASALHENRGARVVFPWRASRCAHARSGVPLHSAGVVRARPEVSRAGRRPVWHSASRT
jgi:hypothetical protein